MGNGVILTCAIGVVGPLMLLTGVGSRRGSSILVAVASAVLFPLAWVEWYIRDELLSDQRRRRV